MKPALAVLLQLMNCRAAVDSMITRVCSDEQLSPMIDEEGRLKEEFRSLKAQCPPQWRDGVRVLDEISPLLAAQAKAFFIAQAKAFFTT